VEGKTKENAVVGTCAVCLGDVVKEIIRTTKEYFCIGCGRKYDFPPLQLSK